MREFLGQFLASQSKVTKMAALSTEARMKYELLFGGYFRGIENTLKQNIPKEICQIIILYQKTSYIFGVGGDILFQSTLKKFTGLKELEKLQCDIKNIFRNNWALMMITANNELYAMGDNSGYRLGTKENESQLQLTKIKDNIKLASTGCENDNHAFIYTVDHKLYGSGWNYDGYLGNGEATHNWTESYVLQQINTDFLQKNQECITKISCGQSWSLFLTNYGCVYSCGTCAHGHEDDEILIPALIDMNNDKVPIIDIESGYYHSFALDKKHRLIGFGDNEYGQININPEDRGYETPKFHEYFEENNIRIKYITAGYCHSLCIDFDDNCYLFGSNAFGQIGDGKNLNGDTGVGTPFKINDVIQDGVIDGSCGDDHSIILTVSNNVITFGKNEDSQCSTVLNDQLMILEPHILDKVLEIGVLETSFIEKVMAINCATVVFVDAYRNLV